MARTAAGLSVLVVDDHRFFAESLAARLLQLPPVDRVAVAFDARDALAQAARVMPDLVLLDVSLGPDSGADVARRLVEQRADLPIVMVSGLNSLEATIQALAAGARAWVPKDVSTEELLQALDEVMMGRRWLPAALVSDVIDGLVKAGRSQRTEISSFVDELSTRQREVLELLLKGLNRAEIAQALCLSPNTVRTHIQVLHKRAGVNSTLALLARAREAASAL